MTFTFNLDGSVTAEEGAMRIVWPTMDDMRSASALVGAEDFYSRAAQEAIVIREAIRADGGNPESRTNLAAKAATRANGGGTR